jgi:hypothetical protein
MANLKRTITLDNGTKDVVPIADASTNAMVFVAEYEHQINEGNAYKAGYGVSNFSLVTDDTISLLFTTPDTTTWMHWTLSAAVTGLCKIQVFENPTISAAGTSVTPFNRNRNSSNTSSMVVTHTPTIGANGTPISTKFIGGTGFKEDIGAEFTAESKIIMKQNEQYLVLCTVLDDDISAQIGGNWRENENK